MSYNMQEDTYTVMNPVGTLSSQSSRGPAYEVPATHTSHSLHNGNGVLLEQRPLFTDTNGAMTNGGHCATSTPTTAGFMKQDEERYVKGAF